MMKDAMDREWEQEKTWIKTLFGLYIYRILRNDLSWGLLNERNREWVHRANLIPNLKRPGYADPENYAGGITFDSAGSRKINAQGLLLAEYLETYRPKSLLEIGPGAGFQTRAICEHPSVKRYVGIDINSAFTDFLRPRLEELKNKKEGFNFELYHGDFKILDFPKVESVVFVSSVHHIPDREELFMATQDTLLTKGSLFAFEPSHYLPRIDLITRKFLRGYYGKNYRKDFSSVATHNFCSANEYANVFRQA